MTKPQERFQPFVGRMAGMSSLAAGYRVDEFALEIESSEKTALFWAQKW